MRNGHSVSHLAVGFGMKAVGRQARGSRATTGSVTEHRDEGLSPSRRVNNFSLVSLMDSHSVNVSSRKADKGEGCPT